VSYLPDSLGKSCCQVAQWLSSYLSDCQVPQVSQSCHWKLYFANLVAQVVILLVIELYDPRIVKLLSGHLIQKF